VVSDGHNNTAATQQLQHDKKMTTEQQQRNMEVPDKRTRDFAGKLSAELDVQLQKIWMHLFRREDDVLAWVQTQGKRRSARKNPKLDEEQRKKRDEQERQILVMKDYMAHYLTGARMLQKWAELVATHIKLKPRVNMNWTETKWPATATKSGWQNLCGMNTSSNQANESERKPPNLKGVQTLDELATRVTNFESLYGLSAGSLLWSMKVHDSARSFSSHLKVNDIPIVHGLESVYSEFRSTLHGKVLPNKAKATLATAVDDSNENEGLNNGDGSDGDETVDNNANVMARKPPAKRQATSKTKQKSKKAKQLSTTTSDKERKKVTDNAVDDSNESEGWNNGDGSDSDDTVDNNANDMARKPPAKQLTDKERRDLIPTTVTGINLCNVTTLKLLLEKVDNNEERLSKCGNNKVDLVAYMLELRELFHGDDDDDKRCSLVCLEQDCYLVLKKKLVLEDEVPRVEVTSTDVSGSTSSTDALDYRNSAFVKYHEESKSTKSEPWVSLQKWMSNLRVHYFKDHPGQLFPSSALYSKSLNVETAVNTWNKQYPNKEDQIKKGTFSKWLKDEYDQDRQEFLRHAHGTESEQAWITTKIRLHSASKHDKALKRYQAEAEKNRR
jgi:hypothetical protein